MISIETDVKNKSLIIDGTKILMGDNIPEDAFFVVSVNGIEVELY